MPRGRPAAGTVGPDCGRLRPGVPPAPLHLTRRSPRTPPALLLLSQPQSLLICIFPQMASVCSSGGIHASLELLVSVRKRGPQRGWAAVGAWKPSTTSSPPRAARHRGPSPGPPARGQSPPSARRSPGRWDSGHSGCSKVALLGTFLESWVQTPDGHVGVTNIQVPCPVGVCTVTWVLSSNPGSATQLP